MTKSKKQFAARQKTQGTGDEFNRAIELTFAKHPWPASRGDLLEHASRQNTFAKSDMARLKQIPHREYYSIKDLMEATREADASTAQGPGAVTTADHNRSAMGGVATEVPVRSHPQYDEQAH
jgi:hypothetical protein